MAARPAAPAIPGDPATTQQALCHLWASVGRLGNRTAISVSSSRWAAAPDMSKPKSTTSTRPANSGPPPNNKPGLIAAKVTVRLAASGRPITSPVRPSRPEGRSTASTGAFTDGASKGRPRPVPYAASTTRSTACAPLGGSRFGAEDASTTEVRTPRRPRRSAATRPSAPLEPFPTRTATRRP